MTGIQYLLVCLAEEAAEVSMAATTALRFGLMNHRPGDPVPNRDVIATELVELEKVADRLREFAAIPKIPTRDVDIIKTRKFERMLLYANESKARGTLDAEALI